MHALLSTAALFGIFIVGEQPHGYEGATLMSLEPSDVVLDRERVEIDGIVEGGRLAAWRISARYTLAGGGPARLEVALPTLGGSARVTPPHQRANDAHIYDLEVTVGGRRIRPKLRALASGAFARAYTWSVKRPDRGPVEVTVSYITGVSRDAEGRAWLSYLLGTGGHWRGGYSDNTHVEIRPNVGFRPCGVGPTWPGATSEAGLSWRGAQLKSSLTACFETGGVFVEAQIEAQMKRLWDLEPADLRLLRNTHFARHGYAFRDQELRAHFDEQWWYRPDPRFTPARLTDADLERITAIREHERR